MNDKNIVWHSGKIEQNDRNKLLDQKGQVIWLTGLSGSGKSTIAVEVEKELYKKGKLVYRLDGDNIRHGLCKDLGFTNEDRYENIRRISEVAKLMADAGIIVLASFISPTHEIQTMSADIIGEYFNLVYVKASVDECINRDPKGLYKKALNGEIKNFTGISQDYQVPENPNLILDTENYSLEENTSQLLEYIL